MSKRYDEFFGEGSGTVTDAAQPLTAEELRTAQATDRPPPAPRARSTGRSSTSARASTPKRPSAARKPAASAVPDYREGINGIFQIAAAPLTVIGLQRRPFLADAATLEAYGPGVAEALNELAKENAQVAAMLERVLAMGPYGLFFAALLPMVAQIMTNHREDLLGITRAVGAVPPEELIKAVLPPDLIAAANQNGQRHADVGGTSS